MSFIQRTTYAGKPAFSRGLLRGGPLVAGVEVSVLISESHSLRSNATRLSLESGAQVSDHVIVEPATVTVSFAMTNAGSGADTARDVFETFKRMLEDRELVELITEHHVYDDMIITGVNPVHQAPYKGALNVTVNLQKIHFVRLGSGGRVLHSLAGGTISKTSSSLINAGIQQASTVADKWLSKAVNKWLGV